MAKKAFVYDGTQWIDIAQSTADLTNYANLTTTPISGFRNAIINGDFSINQRGFTSTTTSGTFGFDRWRNFNSGGTVTTSSPSFDYSSSQPISSYNPKSFLRQVVASQSAAGDVAQISQYIEDVRTFAGQTITISFWAKATSGTPKVSFEFQQSFGTGGSPSATVNHLAGQATLSTSWNRYSISTTLPSVVGKTVGTADSSLQLFIWTSGGTTWNSRTGSLGIQNNTFDFWGVQIEKGTVATPFEQRPIGTELALCQRYYTRLNYPENSYVGQAQAYTATSIFGTFATLPVSMRIVPTCVISSWTHFGGHNSGGSFPTSFSSGSLGNHSTTSIGFIGNTSTSVYTAGHSSGIKSSSASAWIEASAEL